MPQLPPLTEREWAAIHERQAEVERAKQAAADAKRRVMEEAIADASQRLADERAQRLEKQEAARAAVLEKRDAELKRDLRLRFRGSDAEFERLYPELRDQALIDQALGRRQAPIVPSPRVRF